MTKQLNPPPNSNKKVYVMRGRPLPGNYRPFTVVFSYETEDVRARIIEGVAFLRKDPSPGTAQAPQYRQLIIQRDEEGKVVGNGTITADEIHDGEYFWMLILVEGNNLPSAGPGLNKFYLRRD
jgi:hypothetical protein